MNWKALVMIAFLLIVFFLPTASNEAPLPKDLTSEEIAKYIGCVFRYWKQVFVKVFKHIAGFAIRFHLGG
jgi:hypothetical protein